MSPQNALVYVENIRKAFIELDPENAETYNANAAAYSEQLRAIDRELRNDLGSGTRESALSGELRGRIFLFGA